MEILTPVLGCTPKRPQSKLVSCLMIFVVITSVVQKKFLSLLSKYLPVWKATENIVTKTLI